MRLHVRYFASIREALGPSESLEAPADSTVAAVRALLQSRSSAHAQALQSGRAVRCAVNQRLCEEDTVVGDGAELAFFPPVTGG